MLKALSVRRDDIAAAGVAAVFALCFVAIKTGLAYAPPLAFGGLRALIGGAALLGVALLVRQRVLPSRQMWRWIPAIALTGTTFTFGAMFLSPMFTGAGVASVLANMQPLFVIILAAVFLRERMTRGKWVTLGLGLAGAALLSAQALLAPGGDAVGVALALLASLGAATSTVLFKRSGAGDGIVAITGWSLALGSVPLLLAGAVAKRGIAVTLNAPFAATLLFLALAGTALTSVVWYWLVQRNEASRMAMYLFLIPVFGLAVAAVALGEPIRWQEGAGAALIVAGMIAGARADGGHSAPDATGSRVLSQAPASGAGSDKR